MSYRLLSKNKQENINLSVKESKYTYEDVGFEAYSVLGEQVSESLGGDLIVDMVPHEVEDLKNVVGLMVESGDASHFLG